MTIWPMVSKAWTPSDASRDFAAKLEAARVAANLTRGQYAAILGVSESRLSEMESGADPGPAILRFSGMPLGFWISLLKSVIQDSWQIGKASDLRHVIDLVQVWLLDRQLADRNADTSKKETA